MIDHLYKEIHRFVRSYLQDAKPRDCMLFEELLKKSDELIEKSKRKFRRVIGQIPEPPSKETKQEFDVALSKVLRFEAEMSSSLVDFRMAKLPQTSLEAEAQELFPFNLDLSLNAREHGFSDLSTPDFIYKSQVIGDLKTGRWREFLYYTYTAYALAYECDRDEPMNYGAILHVEVSENRQVPVYTHTSMDVISDESRKRFIMLRNRKLKIVHRKKDPGLPRDRSACDICGYRFECWGEQ